MALSKDQIKIVAENPLDEAFATVCIKLRDCTDELQVGLVASLLGALLNSSAAYFLPTPDRSGNIAGKLFAIQQSFRGGSICLENFRPLIDVAIAKSSDADIWEAVLYLLDTLGPPPLSSITPTFKGTPVKSGSSRLADSETREIIERELFYEIKDCTFRNVGGFCDKYFDTKTWCKQQEKMLKGMMEMHNGKKWTEFPASPDEKPVWDWLRLVEERNLANAPYKLQTTKTANQFKKQKGRMDLFFRITSKGASATFEYKQVLVVGEQKKSYNEGRLKADLLHLTRYIRGIFIDQPTRRFVHGFTLCASTMELWVFDRSGPYSSGPFDIHDKPEIFARAIVGYATMDDNAIGLDTFIKREDGYRHVILDDTGSSSNEMRIRLGMPIVRQKAIVCRGTTCCEAENSNVAKFSWASDK
ncbi:hypothetical protein RJ55_02727 [Drechmeria coniospora]|nr:hypothetical protein RJ55_02727 [Drechmeria coniospora]